jgi:hypothetical protein
MRDHVVQIARDPGALGRDGVARQLRRVGAADSGAVAQHPRRGEQHRGERVVVQHTRGVPSHFNDATPLDERLFQFGAVAIVAAIVVLVALTAVAFVRPATTAPMTLAIRCGLVALLVAQATGMWMIVHGLSAQESGASMFSDSLTTYGAAGAMKVAHAVPMHAIQVFCGVAWLVSFSRLPARRQFWLVSATIVVYAGLVVAAIARTAAGQAPF